MTPTYGNCVFLTADVLGQMRGSYRDTFRRWMCAAFDNRLLPHGLTFDTVIPDSTVEWAETSEWADAAQLAGTPAPVIAVSFKVRPDTAVTVTKEASAAAWDNLMAQIDALTS